MYILRPVKWENTLKFTLPEVLENDHLNERRKCPSGRTNLSQIIIKTTSTSHITWNRSGMGLRCFTPPISFIMMLHMVRYAYPSWKYSPRKSVTCFTYAL